MVLEEKWDSAELREQKVNWKLGISADTCIHEHSSIA